MKSILMLEKMLHVLIRLELADQAYVAEDNMIRGKWYAYVEGRNMKAKHRKLHVLDNVVWTT